jgi:hypothetical protein
LFSELISLKDGFMRKFIPRLLLLCTVLAALPSYADNKMRTAGGFAVSSSGAATYSIPIKVPAGVAGFVPTLALSYNSQGDNGLLGVGWTLSGLSAITRCTATVAQDGVNLPDGTNFDRFCLDGRRLTSSKYFDDDTVYQKDIDADRSQLTVAGRAFELTNALGQVADYGFTDDAFLARSPGVVYNPHPLSFEVLAIDILRSAQGQVMNFQYNQDAVNGELTPKRIDYPGTVASTSVALQNSVQFVYDSRPDVEIHYRGGMKFTSSVRLKEVRTYHADALASVYKLSYDQEPTAGRSRLTSVVECAGDGACLPPTLITYAPANAVAFGSPIQSAVIDWGQETGRAWVDVNGDGMADFCRVVGTSGAYKLACTLSTGNGFGETITSAVMDPGLVLGRAWTDVNGDGLPDYCRLTGTTNLKDSRAECILSTGTGFGAKVTSGILDWGIESKRAWRDVDGDSRSDFCIAASSLSNAATCAFSTGNALANPVMLGDPKPIGPPVAELASDAQNFFCRANANNDSTLQYKWCQFFGSYSYSDSSNLTLGWGGSAGRAFADINADGYADYCRVIGASGNSQLACTPAMSAAGSFPKNQTPAVDVISDILDPGSNIGRTWVDVNGDGRADYCRRLGSTNFTDSRIACTLANGGKGFGATVTSDVLDWGQDNGSAWVDVRGDGHPAYCRLTGTVNGQDSKLSCTPLLAGFGGAVQITSGLNNQISIAYKPLTDPSVYTKDTTAVYPQRDVVSGSYVVSSVTLQNGAGGVQTTSYQYGGDKADLTKGRGDLGFRWVQATRVETSLATRTEYAQVWPLLGLPTSVATLLPGAGLNGVLSQLSNTYGCVIPPGGFSCTDPTILATPSRGGFVPYVQTSVQSRWDLNGAVLPVVTTTIAADGKTGKVSIKTTSTSDGYTTRVQNVIGDFFGDGSVLDTTTTETRTKP